jgi:uncharacterized protein YjbI with pentapeptide repeats
MQMEVTQKLVIVGHFAQVTIKEEFRLQYQWFEAAEKSKGPIHLVEDPCVEIKKGKAKAFAEEKDYELEIQVRSLELSGSIAPMQTVPGKHLQFVHDGKFPKGVSSSTIAFEENSDLEKVWLKGARLDPEKLQRTRELWQVQLLGRLEGTNVLAGYFAHVKIEEEFVEQYEWYKAEETLYLQEDPCVQIEEGKAQAFVEGQQYTLLNKGVPGEHAKDTTTSVPGEHLCFVHNGQFPVEITSSTIVRVQNALCNAWLKGAFLVGAHLENVDLREAHLQNAYLRGAHLQNAYLRGAHLQNAYLEFSHLQNTNLQSAHLQNANLREAHLQDADLREACLKNAYMRRAHLENAELCGAHLEDANLSEAKLENTSLYTAHLENAVMAGAVLKGASLRSAYLQGTNLRGANLQASKWGKGCRIDSRTQFDSAKGMGLADIVGITIHGFSVSDGPQQWAADKSIEEMSNLDATLPCPAPLPSSATCSKPKHSLLQLFCWVCTSGQGEDRNNDEDGAEAFDGVDEGSDTATSSSQHTSIALIAARLSFCAVMLRGRRANVFRALLVQLRMSASLGHEILSQSANDKTAVLAKAEKMRAAVSALPQQLFGVNSQQSQGTLTAASAARRKRAGIGLQLALRELAPQAQSQGSVGAAVADRAQDAKVVLLWCIANMTSIAVQLLMPKESAGPISIRRQSQAGKSANTKLRAAKAKLRVANVFVALPIEGTTSKRVHPSGANEQATSEAAEMKGGDGADLESRSEEVKAGPAAAMVAMKGAVEEVYTAIDNLEALLEASESNGTEVELEKELQTLQRALCKAIDAKAEAMVKSWAMQGYDRFSKHNKHTRCRWCRSCCGSVCKFVVALRKFGAMELKQHERELLQMRELIDGLSQMEVKDSNLDEVVASWNLLYDMTSQLTCRAGFMLMRRLVWTPDTRLALLLGRTLTTACAPYPPELVRVFKMRATMRLRESYLVIVREIDMALMVIQRIQGYQTQAYHLLGTALRPVCISSTLTAQALARRLQTCHDSWQP